MIITTGNCAACGACISACPKRCIRMVEGNDGFLIPQVDSESCVQCGRCQSVCPVNRRPEGADWEDGTYYALWANDAGKRKEGSSGGVFGLLADQVLAKGGVVFGAAYSDDYKSVYQTSTDEVPLIRLKKSKYVESNVGNVFAKVKAELVAGRLVLYCGTACQIDGLKSYLNGEYENLLTCDFLCHGVPAAGVFKKYISNLEARYGKVKHVDFRSKAFGWKAYCSRVEFVSGKVYLRTKFLDPYLRTFFENAVLRKSCYECGRLQRSNADITLGDWWRVTEADDVCDTDEGVSLVGVHTEKGIIAIERLINEGLCYSKTLTRDQYAYAYQRKSTNPADREERLRQIVVTEDLFKAPMTLKKCLAGLVYELRARLKRK